MRKFSKFLPLVAAILFAFVGSASAQLQTFETRSTYSGSTFTFTTNGSPMGQTFANVSAVKSMTYDFFAGSGSSTATSLTATFGEWNVGASSFVGGTTVSFGTINVPASGGTGWSTFTNGIAPFTYNSYSQGFDLSSLSDPLINATYGYLTDPSKTYALMLTATSGSGLSLGITNTNAFSFGQAYLGFGYLNDFVFSQIVVAPGSQTLVPVPESSTVASVVVGAMVFGLVGFRINQRRRSEVAPLVTA